MLPFERRYHATYVYEIPKLIKKLNMSPSTELRQRNVQGMSASWKVSTRPSRSPTHTTHITVMLRRAMVLSSRQMAPADTSPTKRFSSTLYLWKINVGKARVGECGKRIV